MKSTLQKGESKLTPKISLKIFSHTTKIFKKKSHFQVPSMPQVIHPSSTSFTHSNGVNFSYSPIFIISPGNLGGSASNESPHINTYEASLQQSSSRLNSLQFFRTSEADSHRSRTSRDTDTTSPPSEFYPFLKIRTIKTKQEPNEDSVNPSII